MMHFASHSQRYNFSFKEKQTMAKITRQRLTGVNFIDAALRGCLVDCFDFCEDRTLAVLSQDSGAWRAFDSIDDARDDEHPVTDRLQPFLQEAVHPLLAGDESEDPP